MPARTTDKIKALTDNPAFISGIYNYCDKWCERCPITARCSVFAMEADDRSPDSRDPENEKFWKHLQGNLASTIELLREMAEEAGVGVDSRTLAGTGRRYPRFSGHAGAVASRNGTAVSGCEIVRPSGI